MNFIIVFMLPSVLGIKIFNHLNGNKIDFNALIYYLLLVLFSNYGCMCYLALTNKLEVNLVEYALGNYIFSIKYITLMLVLNAILSVIFTIIRKYFVFSIEVENDRKKKENK